jgi:hypothetical protein
MLVTHFDAEENFVDSPGGPPNKDTIRKMFLLIEKYIPQSRPQRAIMNDLNRFLMTPPEFQKKFETS